MNILVKESVYTDLNTLIVCLGDLGNILRDLLGYLISRINGARN